MNFRVIGAIWMLKLRQLLGLGNVSAGRVWTACGASFLRSIIRSCACKHRIVVVLGLASHSTVRCDTVNSGCSTALCDLLHRTLHRRAGMA